MKQETVTEREQDRARAASASELLAIIARNKRDSALYEVFALARDAAAMCESLLTPGRNTAGRA